MEELISHNYRLITGIVEWSAAITGILCYNRYKFSTVKFFIWFLVYLSICDYIGGYTWYVHPNMFLEFLIGTLIEKNCWFYTLFWKIGAIMFFAFYYKNILKSEKFKLIIKFSSYLFLLFSLIVILLNLEAFFDRFFSSISVFGSVIIFMCTVFYFVETLQSDSILEFYKSINFYISVTIFIWWLIITPLIFFELYSSYEVINPERDWNYVLLKWYIYFFSNLFMYSTFTFALIFCKPEIERNTIDK